MELNKAITEIRNILDTWLRNNGFDLTTRFEQDFAYYHNKNGSHPSYCDQLTNDP